MKGSALLRLAYAALGLVLLTPSMAVAQAALNLYVSPSGSDRNAGTAQRPLATLEEARTRVLRVLAEGKPHGDVTVWLGGGLYVRSESFVLGPMDSGSPGHPVTYRAMPGETPRIFGGARLSDRDFAPVIDHALLERMTPAARGHIVAAHLSGEAAKSAAPPEIFHGNGGLFRLLRDDRILPLSRWPNAGYTTMASVVDSGIAPPRGGSFHYRDEVAEHAVRWSEAAKAHGLWLTGFWRVPFEVESVRVASIDSAQKTITLAAPVPNGIGSKYGPTVNGNRTGDGKEQYYASNLLEEIDTPGEWSYDFASHTLYVWPPEGAKPAEHEWLIANLAAPVIQLKGASDVVLEGLTVEGSTQQGIEVRNGQRDLVASCTLRNIGGGGIDFEGGVENRIQSNDLMHLGNYGIHVVAGDRPSLTSGRSIADNNHVAYIGELDRITEGIYLDGVGNTATHNLIHDASYNGIRYQGNDQRMAYNEIHHVGLDAGDLGVFYTNGDWAAQGNRIEYNFGHHSPNAQGSYIDDGASGRTMVGNIFYKLSSGVFLGGGHNNVAEGNLIVDSRLGIHVDNRGVARHYDENAPHLTRFLHTIHPDSPPWSTRYPNMLQGILEDPTQPTGNRFENNALVGDEKPYQLNPPAKVDPTANPVIQGDPMFVDAARMDFRLRPGSPILKALPGFQVLPPESFGLYVDAYRKTLPSDEETGRNVDRDSAWRFDSNQDVKASDRMGAPATPQPRRN